jgi:hypothetical protein
MNSFLPQGFESLRTERSYVNLSKLSEGEYKFRIVKRPIAGWVDWKDRKPYRYRPDAKPAQSFDDDKPMKAFWGLYVWDYTQDGLFIMEVTQVGIMKALTNLAMDEDWGDFTSYDIKIKKSGSGKETEYSVSPVPHKPMLEKISSALAKRPVNLEALYDGKDPWKDLDSSEPAIVRTQDIAETPIMILRRHLRDDNMDDSFLGQYLEDLSRRKEQTIDHIVEAALMPTLLPKFKLAYIKEFNRSEGLALQG